MGFNLSVVVAVIGDYPTVEAQLAKTLSSLEMTLGKWNAELVVGLGDSAWYTTPLIQTLNTRFGNERVKVFCSDSPDVPAATFNQGIHLASGKLILCLWPGSLPNSQHVINACSMLELRNLNWVAGISPDVLASLEMGTETIERYFLAYFLSIMPLFSLDNVVFQKSFFENQGGFNSSPLLQRNFDVEFWHRATLKNVSDLLLLNHLLTYSQWSWQDYPIVHDFRVPAYVSKSFRVRSANRYTPESLQEIVENFHADLPERERQVVQRIEQKPQLKVHRNVTPYRVAVIGGPWESHHNFLCFFNYFQLLEGQGRFTYIPLLDLCLDPKRDLRSIDLIIISRGQSPVIREVLAYANQHGIPTMYMIDDNWISIAKDWPDPYANIYADGLPRYEIFKQCLRECDAVLLYNRYLAEDVRQFTDRVILIPTNIRETEFLEPLDNAELKTIVQDINDWRDRTNGIVVGYAGTLRNESEAAFKALARIASNYADKVKVLLFGFLSQEQKELFRGNAVIIQYVVYSDYAALMGELRPDVLIGPLQKSRTAMSKCPNKYLEYSIVGAVGVYSNMPPYADVITSGENGILVENNGEEDWYQALDSLLQDESLRKKLSTSAYHNVISEYETGVVAPHFIEALESVINGKSWKYNA